MDENRKNRLLLILSNIQQDHAGMSPAPYGRKEATVIEWVKRLIEEESLSEVQMNVLLEAFDRAYSRR